MERGQATRPRRGDELELQIDRLAYGGAGVARANGYVVFVRDAVPGDRVRARVTRSRRSFAEADSVELLEPSPVRVEPVAPHPGAPWQVLPYERQLGEKEAQVRDALERLGGFESPPVEPILPADQRLGYRNKVEYSFGADEDGELVLGFHRRGRFDVIDDVSRDILASDRVDAVREAVKAWCRAEGLSAWDRRTQSGLLRNLVVREGRRTGRLQARLVTSPRATFRASELAAATPADSVLWTRAASVAETTREGETERVKGPLALEEKLSGLTFRISPDAFFQTNTEMAERLYGTAGELAGLTGRERVLDLFCGIGTIAEGSKAGAGGGGETDRLRLVQPDDARPERSPDGRRRLPPEDGAAGGHVSADAAHRVRRAAGARGLARRRFVLVQRDLLARVDRAQERSVGLERRLDLLSRQARAALRAGALDDGLDAVLL